MAACCPLSAVGYIPSGPNVANGPPEREGYRIPDKQAQGTQMFVFAKDDGQRWLWCGYGGKQLAKRLDDKATICTITTKTKKPANSISAVVVCR
jgi:hypothetical protein